MTATAVRTPTTASAIARRRMDGARVQRAAASKPGSPSSGSQEVATASAMASIATTGQRSPSSLVFRRIARATRKNEMARDSGKR